MICVFGDYALDTHLYELRHHGELRPLGPQVFNVLGYLIARSGWEPAYVGGVGG